MKLVQSFWSKPYINSAVDADETRLHGGWIDKKYYYMSWALSCLQLCRYYDHVELVTDRLGKEILIDTLELPYTNVRLGLDDLNDYPADLWALGKLYAYGLQNEPFLHVDSDLFIWEELRSDMTKSPLVAQHLEKEYAFYKNLMEEVAPLNLHIPECIKARHKIEPINAYNMGITGGHDLEFFRFYTIEAFKFINANKQNFSRMALGPFNTIFEQVLFYSLAQTHQKPVNLYTYTTGEHLVDDEMKGLERFRKTPPQSGLTHLYGSCKGMQPFCDEVSYKLKKYHPASYEKIMDIVEAEAVLSF